MAVTAVNLARISFNQRLYNLREAMRMTNTGLYHVQNQLATGLRFLQPSEDPLRASAAADLDRRLERLDRVAGNLRDANAVLTEGEAAAQEAVDLAQELRSLAIQVVDDGTTPEEREALGVVVNSLLNQLVAVGNRQYLNTYLFAGQQAGAPFALRYGGVYYSGDANRMATVVEEDFTADTFTIPGMELFGAVSAEMRGVVDLDPALTPETRISAVEGALGRGVELGRILVTAGASQVEIDLSGADTMGDLIDKLNDELPAGMTATLGTRGINLTQAGPGPVTIRDVGGGRAAIDLGLSVSFGGVTQVGPDLHPRLTPLTPIAALQGGAGVSLASSITIRNGSQSATLDLSSAQTMQDILNIINGADVGAWARISADGKSLDVVSRVSGINLTIEENGGLTATRLGIRTMHAGTALSELNDGLGVQTAPGDDLRITTASGATIDVDLDGAATLQDVLDRLNAAGGGALTASLVSTGNGLLVTDHTAGGGTLTIEALNDSAAVRNLGLDVAATGNQLVGRDVCPVRADNVFTALLELQEGMLEDNRLDMQAAGRRLERVLPQMLREQGKLAAQARMMDERSERVETETTAARILLSDVRDVDFTQATVRFQQLQTALQANLTTASKLLNLSLLDYLR